MDASILSKLVSVNKIQLCINSLFLAKQQPFRLNFQSDNWEHAANEVANGKSAVIQIGYNLAYSMTSNDC